MLEIFNRLAPFFEDCYREISVREYSRMIKISPPSASVLLKSLEDEGLLKKREDKGYLLFRTNRESQIMKELSRIYWKIRLNELIDYLSEKCQTAVLFGSLSKLEAKKESDIDLTVISNNKSIDLLKFEKVLGRKIQLFIFKKINEMPKELRENVINGFLLSGRI